MSSIRLFLYKLYTNNNNFCHKNSYLRTIEIFFTTIFNSVLSLIRQKYRNVIMFRIKKKLCNVDNADIYFIWFKFASANLLKY